MTRERELLLTPAVDLLLSLLLLRLLEGEETREEGEGRTGVEEWYHVEGLLGYGRHSCNRRDPG